MQKLAINAMLYKVPLSCLAILTVGLALINLVGLIKVEMDTPNPRLILLLAFYLVLMCGIILTYLKTLEETKKGMTCIKKASEE